MFWIFWDHYLNTDNQERPARKTTTSARTRPHASSSTTTVEITPEDIELLSEGLATSLLLEQVRVENIFPSRTTQTEVFSEVPIAVQETVESAEEEKLPAQRKYNYLTAFSNEALCVFDGQGDCTYLSPNWERITGYGMEECLGSEFIQKIHPEHQYKIREKIQYLKDMDTLLDIRTKCQIEHYDGSMQWYDISFVAFEETKDGGREYVSVLRNINQDVVAQKTLHKAKLEAELALRARSEFLANMSHELRTPLNAIIGFTQIMDSQMFGPIDNPRYEDYITNIQESGYNLLSKINDLLEIANLDSGRIKLSEEAFDIIELVRHVIQIHSHHAFSSHVTIRENLFKDAVIVRADRVKMQQVLSNVLSNSMRYNREGGNVTVSTRIDDGDNLVISIKDSGIGIDSGHLTNIVDAFKHKDSFFSRELGGIGLGLALVKEFVILHGGQFSIDSKMGKGTTVYITLPRERIVLYPASDLANEAEKQAV